MKIVKYAIFLIIPVLLFGCLSREDFYDLSTSNPDTGESEETPSDPPVDPAIDLTLLDTFATSCSSVTAVFSKEPELAGAETAGNYSIPGLDIYSVSADPDRPSAVDIFTSEHQDINYSLTVSNLTDLDNNTIVYPNTKTFAGDTPPYIKSISSYSNKEVVIYFSEAVDPVTAAEKSNYNITELTITSAELDVSDPSKVTLLTSSQIDGKKYTITVGPVKDLTGNNLSGPGSKEFTGNGPTDSVSPTILFAEMAYEDTAEIQFSEPMDPASSEQVDNYTLKDKNGNSLVIVSAARQPDHSRVRLVINGTFPENMYILTVDTDVLDEYANPLAGYPKNTVTFAGTGTTPDTFDDGPVIVDPIGDGTNTFSMLASYRGYIYIGPSENNDAMFRLKPDGSDPEIISFIFRNGEDEDTTSLSPGPDGEEGINYICGGKIGETEYLFIGPYKTADGSAIDFIYKTADMGSTVEFYGLDVGPYLGYYTKSVSSMIVFNNYLYIGFPNRNPWFGDGPKKPYFIKAASIEPFEAVDLNASYMPRIGYYGGNRTMRLGIDSMCVYNDRLYIANGGRGQIGSNGGIIRSTSDNPGAYLSNPGDWEDVTPVGETEWHAVANDRFSIELSKVDRLIPADRAFPAMTVYHGKLYAARNTTDGPQVWKYDGSQWELVADNGSGLSDMGRTGNSVVSLLVVNGDRLYIGYDNSTDGVHVWRTVSENYDPLYMADFEPVTEDGMGDAQNNLRIYHGISIADRGKDYLWLLCGRENGSLRVFRTHN
jgi:hypothetical protein